MTKLLEYLEEYRKYLAESKNLSGNTVYSYCGDIQSFIKYLRGRRIYRISSVKPSHLSDFIKSLETELRSKATISRNVASLRSFFKYLLIAGFINDNPAKALSFERVERKIPSVMSEDEISALLTIPKTKDFKRIRDIAMLELLYATGIKSSELCELQIKDVNLNGGYVRCQNSKNERELPLYPSALTALRRYLRAFKAEFGYTRTSPLFVNTNGTKLSRQGFWKIVKTYVKQLGLPEDINAATVRNSVAVSMLERGAPTEIIQKLLGYKDISAAEHYVRAAKDKLKTQYIRFHPRGKK